MNITDQMEALLLNEALYIRLTSVQDLRPLQEQYAKMLEQGLIQKKKGYNLAPVNILGTAIPGQTTYKLEVA